jgi:hypothetical protein
MSQLNVDALKDRTGSGQPDIAGAAKAWVNFDGTGVVAINDSFNVSSITDNGVGNYTVNFINNIANTNYAASGSSGNSSTYITAATFSITDIQVICKSNSDVNTDSSNICAIVFGD